MSSITRVSGGDQLFVSSGVLQGVGAQGPRGPAGPVGPQGAQGPAGPRGPVGNVPQGSTKLVSSSFYTTGSGSRDQVSFSSVARDSLSLVTGSLPVTFVHLVEGLYIITVSASGTGTSGGVGIRTDVGDYFTQTNSLDSLGSKRAATWLIPIYEECDLAALIGTSASHAVMVTMVIAHCGPGMPGPIGPTGLRGPAGPAGATGPAGPSGAGIAATTTFDMMT